MVTITADRAGQIDFFPPFFLFLRDLRVFVVRIGD
jgi:hypothetical protein